MPQFYNADSPEALNLYSKFITTSAHQGNLSMLLSSRKNPSYPFFFNDERGARYGTVRLNFQYIDPTGNFRNTPTLYGGEGTQTYLFDFVRLDKGELASGIQDVPITQQVTNINLRKGMMKQFEVQSNIFFDRMVFNQMAGYTPVNPGNAEAPSEGQYMASFCNPVSAIYTGTSAGANDSDILFAQGDGTVTPPTTDAEVAAEPKATLRLSDIRRTEAIVQNADYSPWPIAPADHPWGRGYILITSMEGMRQLTEDAQATGITMERIELAKISGGKASRWSTNFLDAYKHSQTTILASPRIPRGVTADAVEPLTRRSIFLGRACGGFAWGDESTDDAYLRYIDDRRLTQFSARCYFVGGFKAVTPQNADGTVATFGARRHGSRVLCHYEA